MLELSVKIEDADAYAVASGRENSEVEARLVEAVTEAVRASVLVVEGSGKLFDNTEKDAN